MDEVVDIFHEVLVYLAGLADHPPLAAEDIDCKNRKQEEDNHQPSSLDSHVNQ